VHSKQLAEELARRAAAEETPAAPPQPPPSAIAPSRWTPGGVIAVIAALGGPAALSAIGSQVIGAINARAAAQAELAQVQGQQQRALADEIAAARKTCGDALARADAAASQAAAANAIAESFAKTQKKR
jgi:hypothetical protein